MLDDLREAATDDKLIKEIADALARKHNLPSSEEAVRNSIGMYVRESATPQDSKNSFLESLLQNPESIAAVLLNKTPWRVLRPPDGMQFVTTDNPLIGVKRAILRLLTRDNFRLTRHPPVERLLAIRRFSPVTDYNIGTPRAGVIGQRDSAILPLR